MTSARQIADGISNRLRKPLFGFSAFALLAAAFALVKFIIHILTARGYGFFCDELYAFDMSSILLLTSSTCPP